MSWSRPAGAATTAANCASSISQKTAPAPYSQGSQRVRAREAPGGGGWSDEILRRAPQRGQYR